MLWVPCLSRSSLPRHTPTTRTIPWHPPPVCHAQHAKSTRRISLSSWVLLRSLQDTRHLAPRSTTSGKLSSRLPEMDYMRDDSAIFEDVFCLCDFALLGYLRYFNGEDTKTSPCWQCDQTERSSPGTTSATLVTASCDDFGIAVLMTTGRFMGTTKSDDLDGAVGVAPYGTQDLRGC